MNTENQDWAALASEVKKRRVAMRFPQDLTAAGGPGEITTRKIERGEGASATPRTWARLEVALSWRPGAVDRILSGTATEDDLNPRHAVPPGPARTGGSLRGGGSGVMTVVNIADTVGVVDNATASYGPDVLALARATYQIEQAIAELAGCERTPRVAAAMGALTRARRLTLAEQVTPGDDV